MIDRGISDMLARIANLEREVERLRTIETPQPYAYGFQATGTGTISTASTSFVITDVQVPITKRRGGTESLLFVFAAANGYHSSPGNDVYIGFAVNGVTGVVQGYPVRVPSGSIQSNVIAYVFSGVAAGSQRVDMYYRVDTGTGNLFGGYRWLLVVEGPWRP